MFICVSTAQWLHSFPIQNLLKYCTALEQDITANIYHNVKLCIQVEQDITANIYHNVKLCIQLEIRLQN
jgi:hypothetical protein